eukprot:SAG11_NODE_100_length_16863_cov_12.374911_9_plen_97_part_00
MQVEVAGMLAETNAAQYVYHHGGLQKEGEDLQPHHMIKAENMRRMVQVGWESTLALATVDQTLRRELICITARCSAACGAVSVYRYDSGGGARAFA